jgi:hypothetical protein
MMRVLALAATMAALVNRAVVFLLRKPRGVSARSARSPSNSCDGRAKPRFQRRESSNRPIWGGFGAAKRCLGANEHFLR